MMPAEELELRLGPVLAKDTGAGQGHRRLQVFHTCPTDAATRRERGFTREGRDAACCRSQLTDAGSRLPLAAALWAGAEKAASSRRLSSLGPGRHAAIGR